MLFSPSSQDLIKIERAHRFCLKKIQGMSKLTRTDVALSMLQMTDMLTIIDRRKLILFGRLCRLKTDNIIKVVLLKRLCNFYSNTDTANQGYFNGISKVLKKYDLFDHLHKFYSTSYFPNQSAWKKASKNHTNRYFVNCWMNDTEADPDFYLFTKIHPAFCESIFWHISKCNYKLLLQCRNAVSMISKFGHSLSTRENSCDKCGILYKNVVIHCLGHCLSTSATRLQNCNTIRSKFGDKASNYYNSFDQETRVCISLGAPVTEFSKILRVSHIKCLINLSTGFHRTYLENAPSRLYQIIPLFTTCVKSAFEDIVEKGEKF